ncbi:MAG TPA: MBL fold metallo-hydrolase [Blastocatellia bacterium]|nr:MBL fold metallo-hydrolase [Blastocatellia bacterium]
MNPIRFGLCACAAALLLALTPPSLRAQQGELADNPLVLLRTGQDQKKALKVNEAIYQAIGFGNTFMVTTSEGNVIIDTSMPFNAARHKQLLQAENNGAIRFIIVTHAHGDHIGGIPAWRQTGTQVIAQKLHADFRHYEARLNGFFAQRNAAQFALKIPDPGPWPGNYAGKIEPNVLFDDRYEFELGGVKFELLHTPGETPDHTTIWLPKYKAAFIGDNYYDSFPNIYTLRGTQPRQALDYINSLNKVLALRPEIVLPSHGLPIVGNAEITKRLTRYRDAIQYVHDETVKGMNAGRDVWTLMREIRLPPALDVGEGYGKLSWSVRGIYEGYVGWFDLNPATMYETPASAVYPEVVRLAGGPDAIAKLALERVKAGQPVEALHLCEMALSVDAAHRPALEAKLKALELLIERCRNSNERGWLMFSLSQTKNRLNPK